MTTGGLMMEGVEIMLYGVGFVYLFLVLLIYCIKGMSVVISHLAPEHPVQATAAALHVKPSAIAAGPSSDELAAIQTAVNQHRARRS
jgi:oxaloacetate decarboxylase gamma subunit